jgi:hypothetical protein
MARCSRRARQRRRRVLRKYMAILPRYTSSPFPDDDLTPRERRLSWEQLAPLGLESVLNLSAADVGAFFDEGFEREPRLFERSCAGSWLAALPRWADVFEVVARCERGRGAGLAQALVFKDGAPSTAYASAAHGWLDAASIIVNRLDAVWEGARQLSVDLRHHLPHAYCQLYATPASAQAVDAHADDRDVFVVQLEGSKRWVVYGDPPVPLPNPSEQAGKCFALPVDHEASAPRRVEATLHRGDVLYVPRGYVHEAKTAGEASLHATVAVATYDWTWAKLCAAASTSDASAALAAAARLEKRTVTPRGAQWWRRCADPALVCAGHGAARRERARKVAGVAGEELDVAAEELAAAFADRLKTHRAAQAAPIDGDAAAPPKLRTLAPGVFVRRLRDGEAAKKASGAGGLVAREEMAAILPVILAAVSTAPFDVDKWTALDPLSRSALAAVAVDLGILVVCGADGARV